MTDPTALPSPESLSTLTLIELRAAAKALGIPNASRMAKADLLAACQARVAEVERSTALAPAEAPTELDPAQEPPTPAAPATPPWRLPPLPNAAGRQEQRAARQDAAKDRDAAKWPPTPIPSTRVELAYSVEQIEATKRRPAGTKYTVEAKGTKARASVAREGTRKLSPQDLRNLVTNVAAQVPQGALLVLTGFPKGVQPPFGVYAGGFFVGGSTPANAVLAGQHAVRQARLSVTLAAVKAMGPCTPARVQHFGQVYSVTPNARTRRHARRWPIRASFRRACAEGRA